MNGPSVAHNLRADCIGAPFIMGPNEAIPIPPLVSYAMLSDVIDTTAIYFYRADTKPSLIKQRT